MAIVVAIAIIAIIAVVAVVAVLAVVAVAEVAQLVWITGKFMRRCILECPPLDGVGHIGAQFQLDVDKR